MAGFFSPPAAWEALRSAVIRPLIEIWADANPLRELAEFCPPTIVLDEEGLITYCQGEVAPFISRPPGRITRNFLELVRPALCSSVDRIFGAWNANIISEEFRRSR